MKNQKEYYLQKQICQWLSFQYPNVLYLSDTVASVKLTMPQAKRNKAIQKAGFKTPDLIIFEPKRNFCGLFLEIKIKSPFKKDGSLYANEHLIDQQKTLKDLCFKGYIAEFVWSFEMATEIIKTYLSK